MDSGHCSGATGGPSGGGGHEDGGVTSGGINGGTEGEVVSCEDMRRARSDVVFDGAWSFSFLRSLHPTLCTPSDTKVTNPARESTMPTAAATTKPDIRIYKRNGDGLCTGSDLTTSCNPRRAAVEELPA